MGLYWAWILQGVMQALMVWLFIDRSVLRLTLAAHFVFWVVSLPVALTYGAEIIGALAIGFGIGAVFGFLLARQTPKVERKPAGTDRGNLPVEIL